jgi:hypothetical protein
LLLNQHKKGQSVRQVEMLRVRNPAPGGVASVARRRPTHKLGADDRMDAVRTDEETSLRDLSILEASGDARTVRLETDASMTRLQMHRIESLRQRSLQVRSVGADRLSATAAAQVPEVIFAEQLSAIGHRANPLDYRATGDHRLLQAEAAQCLDRIGLHGQAGADFADFRGALEDGGCDADLAQGDGRCQSTDAAADNKRTARIRLPHRFVPPSTCS